MAQAHQFEFEASGKLKPLTEEELATADSDSSIIVCDQGINTHGRPYWVYIAVKPSKYSEFRQLAANKQPIRFKDYGTILRYGFSEEVPAKVKQEMKEKYGCDDNYMEHLAMEVRQQQAAFLKAQEDQRIGNIVAMLKKND